MIFVLISLVCAQQLSESQHDALTAVLLGLGELSIQRKQFLIFFLTVARRLLIGLMPSAQYHDIVHAKFRCL